MNYHRYDVIVVGAGPAGLGAARTLTRLGFETLVLDRGSQAGDQQLPSCAAIAPVPGFVSGMRYDDGSLYFPALDLRVPARSILGIPAVQRFVSPGGFEFQAQFARRDDFPVAMVDRTELLGQLAGQAETAGAELRFGVEVEGLLIERDAVVGVRTASGETLRAEAVLSAEGAARTLCLEAGFFGRSDAPERRVTVLAADLAAPQVGQGSLGEVVTLGRRYTSATHAFGTVLLPAPGRASVYLSLFDEGLSTASDEALWPYLDEYLRNDPRVRGLLARSTVLRRTRSVMTLRDAPRRVARDGMLGIGDAVTPGGYLGVVPAIYMGRQAALVMAEALECGDVSAECLAAYQQLNQGPVLRSLEAEARMMLNMTGMADDDLDRLCHSLSKMSLAAPFFGNWRTVAWDTVGWLVRQFPSVIHEWDVLQQALDGVEPSLVSSEGLRAGLDPRVRQALNGVSMAVAPALPGLRADDDRLM